MSFYQNIAHFLSLFLVNCWSPQHPPSPVRRDQPLQMTQIWRKSKRFGFFFLIVFWLWFPPRREVDFDFGCDFEFDLPLGAHLSCGSWTIKCRGTEGRGVQGQAVQCINRAMGRWARGGEGGFGWLFAVLFLGFLLFFWCCFFMAHGTYNILL